MRTPVDGAAAGDGVQAEAEIEALLARPPVATRYGAAGRPVRSAGPRAGRLWSATSVVLAAAGAGAIVFLPQAASPSARVDVPLAVGAAAAPAAPIAATSPGGQSPPAATDPRQLPASDPVGVQIPALGMTSAVMELGLEDDGAMEVPPGAYPVGWYDGSSTPGELGPAVLAGHVDWEGEPGAFYGLRELRRGDTVVIDRADGSVVTFTVDRVEEHAKDAFPTEDVYGDTDDAALRLITCGGDFDEETGDYQDNVIVFASLTDVG